MRNTTIDPADLMGSASRLIDAVEPGEELEVYLAQGRELEIRAFEGSVESLSQASSAGVGVRVIRDNRQGFAYVGSLDETAFPFALAEARDNARFATPDECMGLALPDGVQAPVLALYDDSVLTVPVKSKIALILDVERQARSTDTRIRQVTSADYADYEGEHAIATTTGIVVQSRRTACRVSVSVVAGDGSDSHTGYGLSAGRGFEAVDPAAAVTEAVERAVRLLGAKTVASRNCVVVFDPRVVATLLSLFGAALSGEAVTKGRSMFTGRMGELVGVTDVTIVDDPTDPAALSAASYDGEGLACRRNELVSKGRLSGFVHDSVSARRSGGCSTGSAQRGGYASSPTAGCRALAFKPGDLSPEDMLEKVGEAVYVQSVTGVHSGASPVSGDLSVGVEGLLVERGQFSAPVREVTIASTMQRMLQSVVAIGNDVRRLPGIASGVTLAIDGIALSGS